MKATILASLMALAPLPGAAHPHIFVDAGVHFLFDTNGKLAAVQVVWSYDEFYSLLQLEELELDADGDGTLTADESAVLAGFDTNWVEGYEGDIYLVHDDVPVQLGPPMEPGARVQDGRIVTWHIRPILNRIDANKGEIGAKVYDPTFYTAYTLDLGVKVVDNDDCTLAVAAADLPKAYDTVERLLKINAEDSSETDPEDGFPAVGELFADTMTLTCAPSY